MEQEKQIVIARLGSQRHPIIEWSLSTRNLRRGLLGIGALTAVAGAGAGVHQAVEWVDRTFRSYPTVIKHADSSPIPMEAVEWQPRTDWKRK